MAPEQLSGKSVDRRCDIFAAGIVGWEMLAGCALFVGDSPALVMHEVLHKTIPPPSEFNAELPRELDRILGTALHRKPEERYSTAEEMAIEIERVGMATPREVALWVRDLAADALETRADLVAKIESGVTLPSIRTLQASAPKHDATQDVPRHKLAEGEAAAKTIVTGYLEFAKTEISPPEALGANASAPRTRWRRGAFAVLVVLALTAAAYGIGAFRARETPHVAALQASAPPLPEILSERAAAPSSSIDPRASASVSAPPVERSAQAPRLRPRPAAVVSAARSAEPSAPVAKCDPPYQLDARGVRHFKPECLK
jgi:serine/threonine-protein kinase